MKKLMIAMSLVLFSVSSVLAGPTTAKGAKPKTGAGISESTAKTMKTVLETAGIKGELAQKYKQAGLPEMKADIINKLSSLKPEQKVSFETVLSRSLNTLINARSATNLGENGKLIVQAATSLATGGVEMIVTDKGTIDTAKIELVSKKIEEVSSLADLQNEGVLLAKITEINAVLGNGRTIKDLIEACR